MWVTLCLRKKELKQEHAYYQLEDLKISREKRQLDRRKRYEQSLIQLRQKEALNPIKSSYEEKISELNKERDVLNQYLTAVKNIKNNTCDNYVIDGNNKDTDHNKLYMKNTGGNYVAVTDNGSTTFYNLNDLYQADGKYYESEEGYNSESRAAFEIPLDKNSDGGIQRYNLVCDLSKFEDVLSKYHLSSDLSEVNSSTDTSGLESMVNGYQSNIQLELQNMYTQRLSDESATKEIYENELELLEDEVGDEETELELEQNDIETQMEYISSELQAIGDAASNEIQQNVIKLT